MPAGPYEQWWDRWSAEAPQGISSSGSLWLRGAPQHRPRRGRTGLPPAWCWSTPPAPGPTEALLRLGYAAEARGAAAEAREHFQRLVAGPIRAPPSWRRPTGGCRERSARPSAGPDAPRVAPTPQPQPAPPCGALGELGGAARGLLRHVRRQGCGGPGPGGGVPAPPGGGPPAAPSSGFAWEGSPMRRGPGALLGEVRSRGAGGHGRLGRPEGVSGGVSGAPSNRHPDDTPLIAAVA